MRKPVGRLYVFWIRDTSGAWFHASKTNRAEAHRLRNGYKRRGYEVTELHSYWAVDKGEL